MNDLKENIKKSGLKQKYIAQQLGLPYTYLNDMLHGRRNFPQKHLHALEQFLARKV